MAWLFVPGSEGLSSDSSLPSAPPIGLFVTLKGTDTPQAPSWRGWRRRPWNKLLSGMKLSHSTASLGVESFILSQRASLASRGLSPADTRESKTSDGFGVRLPGSFGRFSLRTSSWRTLEVSLAGDSKLFSGTWPKAGTMRNGIASERPTWEPRMVAADFSSSHEHRKRWATPASSDAIGTSGGGQTRSLRKDVRTFSLRRRNWPTPRGSDQNGPGYHGGRGQDLRTEAAVAMRKLYPTQAARPQDFPTSRPTPRSGDGGEQSSRRPRGSLPRLNPDFMEWLMGLPIGWSDSFQREMELSHWWRLSRSLLSELASKGTLSREQLGFEELEEE